MTQESHHAPNRDLLLANHEFPGEYVVKAFGPNDEGFRRGVEAAVGKVMGPRVHYAERTTRSGGRLCITARLDAQSVDEVISVYEELHLVSQLKLIL